jgi:hypothetical protein
MDSRKALKALCEVNKSFHEIFYPYPYSEYTLRAAYLESNGDILTELWTDKYLRHVETFSVNNKLDPIEFGTGFGSSTMSAGADGPFDGPDEATFARVEQFFREKLKRMTGIRSF